MTGSHGSARPTPPGSARPLAEDPPSGSGECVGAFHRATGRALEGDADRGNYHRFQFSLIAPHCGRSVLEVGAGTGGFAARFAAAFSGLHRLVVTDVDPDAVTHLRRRFADDPVVEVRALNPEAGETLDRSVDTAVAINVLEHLEDDVAALACLARSVRPGGTVVLWVPGYQWLYSDYDRSIGHFRRYTPATLSRVAQHAGLHVEQCRPVNLLGALAWWAAARKGRTGSPRPTLVRLYDRLVVPTTRLVERRLTPPFGQSILCVARVPLAGA